jgi:PHD/YefM family antitoxin component YafN of YafNO toxin-antitoxin module
MALPKTKKPSDLRENLYVTLEQVCEGEKFIIPTKHGEVILMKKAEYDLLAEEMELLDAFDEPINFDELTDTETVFKELDRKFGFNSEKPVVEKSKKRSRSNYELC